MPKTVVVTGATGMVGRPLVATLVERGDRVIALARDAARCAKRLGDKVTCVEADLETAGAWRERLAGADAIVHLAGEPIAAKRWDTQQKQKIRDSRVESTRMIVEGFAALSDEQRPKVLVTASGADYYGFANRDLDDDDPVDEKAPAGDSFLSRVCLAWENEACAAESLGVRVVRMRCGVVIGPGEALDKMTKPFKLFAGGRIGSGEQWFSWIALDDAVAAYLVAVDDIRYRGAVNLVAPESTRNRDLARALGKAMHRPSWMPVPGFALRAAVGSELAEYILEGRRVVPTELEKHGFAFAHPTLADALTAAISARSS
jgi:uncharacterized protein (TIGR01777 family)